MECFILKRLLCLSMSLALVNKENIFIYIYDDDELMMMVVAIRLLFILLESKMGFKGSVNVQNIRNHNHISNVVT